MEADCWTSSARTANGCPKPDPALRYRQTVPTEIGKAGSEAFAIVSRHPINWSQTRGAFMVWLGMIGIGVALDPALHAV